MSVIFFLLALLLNIINFGDCFKVYSVKKNRGRIDIVIKNDDEKLNGEWDKREEIVGKISVKPLSSKGFGKTNPTENTNRKIGLSRSEEKKKYQELLKIAKKTPTLKKIVKQGTDAKLPNQIGSGRASKTGQNG